MRRLTIYVDMASDDDFDWLRARCAPPAEDAVALAIEEERLDGDVNVWWDESDA